MEDRLVSMHSRTVATDPDTWIAVPVLPLLGVPREHVEAARAQIKDNVWSSRSGDKVWELDADLLRCETCGWRTVPRTMPDRGKPRHYYVCSSYNKPETCAGVRYHRAEALEREVSGRLNAWFDDPDALTDHTSRRG
jgi:hypothetical protein